MPNDLEIMQGLVAEDIELMKEIIAEDIIPLIQFREQLEKEEFNKAFQEMKRLEGEV